VVKTQWKMLTRIDRLDGHMLVLRWGRIPVGEGYRAFPNHGFVLGRQIMRPQSG